MSVDNVTGLNARDDLLWVVAHWTALRARLAPGGGNGLNGMPRGSTEGRIPIDVGVSDLIMEIAQTTRFYAQALVFDTDWHPETSEMPGLLAGVAQRYGHFTAAEDDGLALAFCDDAHEWRRKVAHVLERPAPPVYVGPCQHRGEDGAGCDGELYVRDGHTDGKCRECGTEFTLMEQREWLEREMQARLMTASEIVSALVVLGRKVPMGTVKSWIARKRLVEAIPDAGLYRLADARDLADRRRA